MDVFSLEEYVLKNYKNFARSFSKFKSPEIKEKVEEIYDSNRYWPDPLIQLNPHYKSGQSIQSFIDSNDLEPECAQAFRNDGTDPNLIDNTLQLWKHQEQAIGYALKKQNFVVTTSTGSGKSLCFFIPIINSVIKGKKQSKSNKTQAIVVYPMNALANSQYLELEKYIGSGNTPLFTFARYTGQESTEERDKIKNNPPDILLTNFMMLELLMTRQNEQDKKVLENCQGLQFIVLDELHTYRGRQGADVAMLMRRLKARVGDPDNPPIYIGTSATMSSKEEEEERKEVVAKFTSRFFGVKVGKEAVITETLRRITVPEITRVDQIENLHNSIQSATSLDAWQGRSNEELKSDPLAIWIEINLGLKNVEKLPERAMPISLSEASQNLSDSSGATRENCEIALRNALIAFSTPELNRKIKNGSGEPLFAFKLHKFISGAGRLYTTLHPEGGRDVTVDGQKYSPKFPDARLYSTYFCRKCGQEFHPVYVSKSKDNSIFETREIDDVPRSDYDGDDDKEDWGFLMPEPSDSGFTFDGSVEDYPETWIEETKSGGDRKIKREYRKSCFKQYTISTDGKISSAGRKMWFQSGRFKFCPACGDEANVRALDFNKLASLTSEGRSSATTNLIAFILRWMSQPESNIDEYKRKLLAFTDNRQDAALQAGHFNDFLFITLLRGATIAAVQSCTDGAISEDRLGVGIQKALGFTADLEFTDRTTEWLVDPDLEPSVKHDVEALLREVLLYRFWIDQRAGWRFTNPNLEELGVLRATYKFIDDIANDKIAFKDIPQLFRASHKQRKEALKIIFDYMRQNLAISSVALEVQKVESLVAKSRGRIKSPWVIEEDEKKYTCTVFMTIMPSGTRLRFKDQEKIVRGTPRSKLGKRIRNLKFGTQKLTVKEVNLIIEGLLKISKKYGLVLETPSPIGGMGWQLYSPNIRFELAKQKSQEILYNQFFQDLYSRIGKLLQSGGHELFGLEGREHTAQVDSAIREIRELRFRYGEQEREQLASPEKQGLLKESGESSQFLPTLFCSPTMELGVDISEMNVVYLRNAPPAPANYAQRSGRAGRSGQAALILTYCAARSPHDQYFFDRRRDIVHGIVVPPAIDFKNRDLIESHLRAEWLAASDAELQSGIKDNLELNQENRPVKKQIMDCANSEETKIRALEKFNLILSVLENDYDEKVPDWFRDRKDFVQQILNQTPDRFSKSFDRWRTLLDTAERSIKLCEQTLGDYNITSSKRRDVENRRRVGERQRDLLLQSTKSQNHDFYLYRYLATEGFLPGYNFPRLPLMAYLQGGKAGDNYQFIQRPRFLAISEFGPHSLIYHEGNMYRVNRALLRDAGERADGKLATQHQTICDECGASQSNKTLNNCQVCATSLNEASIVTNLYRIENVGTNCVERITANDEERRRSGFELQTTFTFERHNLVERDFSDQFEKIATIRFASAARITRINKGYRRREDSHKVGFEIEPSSGYWGSRKKKNSNKESDSDVIEQRIIPFVEDYKNALLLTITSSLNDLTGDDFNATQATIQNALVRGIEMVYQLEDGEILAEPMPSRDKRNSILFYESVEGSAGVLVQLVEDPSGLSTVAENALKVMHYKPESFSNGVNNLQQIDDIECVAGCYRCLLSYFNQLDHELIDRRNTYALSYLLRLASSTPGKLRSNRSSLNNGGYSLPPHDDEPLEVNGVEIEKVWRYFRVVAVHEAELTSEMEKKLAMLGVRVVKFSDDAEKQKSAELQLIELLRE